jgi:hypothetical protein
MFAPSPIALHVHRYAAPTRCFGSYSRFDCSSSGALMRKELSKALRAEFTAAMASRLPQFVPIKVTSRYAWPGSRIFRWVFDPSLHFFVELFLDHKGDDAFGVEVGWSRLGRYPEVPVRPGWLEDAAKAEHWVRLSSFYSNVGGMWSLEASEGAPGAVGQGARSLELAAGRPPIPLEQALARVGPRVVDVMEKLATYALPYFEEVSRSKPSSS